MEQSNEPALNKSRYIICPTCRENIRIKIQDYKIELYDCQNSHTIENLSFKDFEKSQFIDESKIICNFCTTSNKSNTYENKFYTCFSCKKNICPLCKSTHGKNHLMIDYNERYFKCNLHNESYTLYCEQCKKNICIICEKEHKNHKKISLGEFMPDKNILENEKNDLRKKLDEFENEVQKIINKLNNVVNNFEIYYNIYDDMITGYEIQKRNFQILQNLNDINEYNIVFNKEIDLIIKEQQINHKFEKIMNIYDKMNLNQNNEKKNNKDIVIKEKITKINEKNEIKNYLNINTSTKKNNEITETKDKFTINIDNYKDFNIENIEKVSNIKTKNTRKIILLKDKSILSFNNSEFSVYRLYGDKYECDIYYKNSSYYNDIKSMIQLDNENIIIGKKYGTLQLIKLKEKDFEIIEEIEAKIESPLIKVLSNGKIIVYSFCSKEIYFYSYTKENNLILDDKFINTEKAHVNDICEINKKVIAISCSGDWIWSKVSIIFYDLEKDKIIENISTKENYLYFCYMNENSLIAIYDKIYLIDLINYKIKDKISAKNKDKFISTILKINEKGFIFVRDNIYYYEIENNNRIVFEGQNLFSVNYASKYPGNKLLISTNKSIDIYQI